MKKIKSLVNKMSLEEKLNMLTGAEGFKLFGIERLDIPQLTLADGPHGVRKVENEKTVSATCFPTGTALAATWNDELIEEVGEALGVESRLREVDILLGPGVNIIRNPLCGRTFEYFSEDPFLAGKIAGGYIKGLQKTGVSSSIKHFAANNMEFSRLESSSEVDERTLREIYFKPFEIAIKNSNPLTVMCAYNRLNGIFCSENQWLLEEVLKKDWGYSGLVVSDWGAVHNRIVAIKATLELEMPGNKCSSEKIKEAIDKKEISEEEIDGLVEKIIEFIFTVEDNKNNYIIPKDYNVKEIAKKASLESITILQNDGILPLEKEKVNKLCLIGKFAINPRIQGEGSSKVSVENVTSPFDAIANILGDSNKVLYCDIEPQNGLMNSDIHIKAMETAKECDAVLLFTGTGYSDESEIFDRRTLDLPLNDIQMLRWLLENEIPVVVVMMAGSVVAINNVVQTPNAIIHSWLGGEQVGVAIGEIVFGVQEPSGRLPISFIKKFEDCSAYDYYPGDGRTAEYGDGIFVGYRYHDKMNIAPWFPFGHGESYTEFRYSDLCIKNSGSKEQIEISINLENVGKRDGFEIVQVYFGIDKSHVVRCVKELCGYKKVFLKKGEKTLVKINVGYDRLKYYSVPLKSFVRESGNYLFYIGASSKDIKIKELLEIKSGLIYS